MSVTRSSPVQVQGYTNSYSQLPKFLSRSWKKISYGDYHVLAIASDNTLYAWGLNNVGQLGYSDTISRSSPVQISTDTWNSISAGTSISVGIKSNGLLYTWGNNAFYQLGVSDTVDRSSPTQIGTSSWTSVSAGGTHMAAIRSDNKLFTWGYNFYGQLGLDNYLTTVSPTQVNNSSYTSISAGANYTTALTSDYKLLTFGDNRYGQLGTSGLISQPRSYAQIAGNDDFTLAIDTNGLLFAWGLNTTGQLGVGDTLYRSSPVQIGLNSWTSVSVDGGGAGAGAAAIRSDGTLWCWGANAVGQIGDNTVANKSSPVQVYGGGSWTSVAAGISHKIAIKSDGTAYNWGLGTSGQLGYGGVATTSYPVQIAVPTTYSGYSASFDGASQYLTVPYVSGFDIPAGTAWTFECWVYIITYPSNAYIIAGRNWTFGGVGPTWGFSIQTTGTVRWAYASTGTATYVLVETTDKIQLGTWTHLAFDKNTSNLASIFINGNLSISRTDTNAMTNATAILYIGVAANLAAASYFKGYMSNIRITSGVTVYTGNFTVPTPSLPNTQSASTNISAITSGQVQLLTLQNSTIIDNSTNLATITNVGTVTPTNTLAPYSSATPISPFISVGATNAASFGILSDGRFWTWGNNANGALGINDTLNRSAPVQIGSSSWTTVYASQTWVHGFTSDGRIHAWGLGTTGQLGYNDTLSRSSPVQISSTKFSQVAGYASTVNTLALDTTNKLYAWGAKSNKLLSEFSNTNYTYSWSMISTGLSHTSAVRSDGRLYAWGLNSSGQLGDNTTVNRSSPTQIGATGGIGEFWLSTSVGSNVTYAIRCDNTLWAWGLNSNGQQGSNDTITRSSPSQIGTSSNWSIVSTKTSHALAINSLKQLYAWGTNNLGQLGQNDTLNRSSPVQVAGSFSLTSAGDNLSVAINAIDSTVYTWGNNQYGQLGTSDTLNRSSPVQVNSSSYTNISAGSSHVLLIDTLGNIYGFGRNNLYQLGLTSFTNLIISNNNGVGFIKTSDSSLWNWGSNDAGQLGTNDALNRSSPVQVGTESNTVVVRAIQATVGATLATRSTGNLYAWGANTGGRLGTNDTLNRSSPVQIMTGSWTQLAVGVSHSLAIKSDGTLWGWGQNTYGQAGSLSWTQVSSGLSHTLVLRSDGALFGYGLNSLGQLGTSDTLNRSSPTQIGAGNIFSKIAAGQNVSAGIRTDGLLYTWGYNANGSLGDGTTVNRSSPVIVQAGSFSQVSVADYVISLTSQGALLTWGNNQYGQLGNNNTIKRSGPQIVGAGTNTTNSGLFNGTTDGLSLATNAAFTFGTSNFTVEAWIYLTQISAVNHVIFDIRNPDTAGLGFDFAVIGSSLRMTTAGTTYITGGTVLQAFRWYHVACSRSGSTTTQLFLNGVQEGTTNVTNFNFTNSIPRIANGVNGFYWGYMSNLRVIKGQGLFNGTFTPSTSPLTTSTVGATGAGAASSITGTISLLTCQDSTFIDNSGNGFAITLTGTPSTAISNPFGLYSITGATSYNAISAGTHSLAILSTTNTLYAWGLNSSGQLGQTDTINRSSPVQVAGSYTQISASFGGHSLAIDSNSILWAWGNNSAYQLGNAFTQNRSSPAQIGSNSWTNVYAGFNYSVGKTTSNTLVVWGDNTYGQLATTPVISWAALSSNNNSTYALHTDGTVWVWGDNQYGDLGINDTFYRSSPVQLGGGFSVVVANGSGALGLKTNGTLFTWGRNQLGQLGLNDTVNRSNPVQITGSYTQISGNLNGGMFAVDTTGKLYAWGTNTTYQLGLGDTLYRSSPVQVSLGNLSFSQVSAGLSHTLAITNTNQLYVWGKDDVNYGYLGAQTNYFSWSQISSGANHTMAIRSDNLLFGWGSNGIGELGLLDTTNRSSPVQIGTSTWSNVAAGISMTYAVRSDGTLFTFGLNGNGQLGLNDTINRSSPTQVSAGWSSVSLGNNGVGTGAFTGFAITTTKKLYGIGVNGSGQLGIGDTLNRSSPVQITSGGLFTQIAMGGTNNLGIRADGLLYTWGASSSGNLGTNDTLNRSSPTQLGTSSWTQVAIAGANSFAIRSDGTLWSWGNNANGLLGQNLTTTVTRSSPAQVGALTTWNKLATNSNLATGATNNVNQLFVWGYNANGELGLNDLVSRSSPVQLAGSFTYIGSSSQGLAIINNLGQLFTTGVNTNGQLGIGLTTNRSSPVQVLSNKSFTMVYGAFNSASQGFCVALATDNTLWAWGGNADGNLGTNDTISRSSPVQVGSDTWTSITAGIRAAFGIRNNLLYGWGKNLYNGFGPLGLGDTIARSSPTQITTASAGFSTVFTSGTNTFTISNDSLPTFYTWGYNVGGTLGLISDTVDRSTPVQVPYPTTSWNSVSVGSSHIVGIRSDGTLWSWGANTNGALGINSTLNRSSPVQVSTSSWTNVAAGGNISAAIRLDGSLYTWGLNSGGQLGQNDNIPRSNPTQLGSNTWSNVTGGPLGFVAVRSTDKGLFTWGTNTSGQLGIGDVLNRSSPVQIGSSSYSLIGTGDLTGFAVDINGALYAWGVGAGNGKLGINNLTNRSSPVQVAPNYTLTLSSPVQIGSSSWNVISAGRSTSFAIRSDGLLFSWGDNTLGILGQNDIASRSSPTQIGSSSFTAVTTNTTNTFALRYLDGALFTWGVNGVGQLGTNDTLNRSSPTQVGSSSWTNIAAGLSFSLATDSTSRLYAWGLNNTQQLPIYTTTNRSSPTQITSSFLFYSPTSIGTSSYVNVGAGDSQTVLLGSDYFLYATGNNNAGQLGSNNTVTRSSPVQVNTGSLIDNRSSPVQIDSGSWKQIIAGQDYSLGIKGDSTLWAWGINTNGALGTTDILTRSFPVQIGSSNNWLGISTGNSHVVAYNSTGILYAWGLNNAGQLGTNDAGNRSSPVQVGTVAALTNSNAYSLSFNGTNQYIQVANSGSILDFGTGDFTIEMWVYATSAVASTTAPFVYGNYGNGAGIPYFTINGYQSLLRIAYSNDGSSLNGYFTGVAWNLNTWYHVAIVRNSGTLSFYTNGTLIQSDSTTFTTVNYTGIAGIRIGAGDTLFNTWSPGYYFPGYVSNFRAVKGVAVYTGNFTVPTSPLTATQSSGTNISAITSGQTVLLTAQNTTIVDNSTNNFTITNGGSTAYSYNTPFTSFVPVGSLYVAQVFTGNSHTAALDTTNTLYTWGLNTSGQLGLNDTVNRSQPTSLATGLSNTNIFAGPLATYLFSNSNYILYAWGAGTAGALGIGSTTNRSSPTQVGLMYTAPPAVSSPTQIASYAGKSFSIVAAGESSSAAVATDYTLFAWGTNTYGQLGDNTIITKSSPTQIASNTLSIVQVSAGFSNTAYVTTNTAFIYTHGVNNAGQMGDNTTVTRSSPVQIFTGTTSSPLIPLRLDSVKTSSFTQVQAGQAATAIALNGTLFTWGTGTTGQLGIVSTIARSSPVQVGGQAQLYSASPVQVTGSWNSVSAGYTHAIAIDSTSKLFGWGVSVANGDSINRSSPVQITYSSYAAISAGNNINAVLDKDFQLYTWGINDNYAVGIPSQTLSNNISVPTLISTDTSWTNVGSTGGGASINTALSMSVPNAPIIGVATAIGGLQATITFTQPNFDGYSIITKYTAVSSTGNLTGSVVQSGSGTITISGLSLGVNYTFTVYATNVVGNSASSSASNQITAT